MPSKHFIIISQCHCISYYVLIMKKVFNFLKLNEFDSRMVDIIADEIRKDYVEFLVGLGKKYEKDIDWWMLNFASRNTMLSPLFRNICYLIMLKKKLNEGQTFDEIIVDSRALRGVLNNYCSKNNHPTKVIYKGKNIVKIIFKRIYSYIVVIMHILLRSIYALKTVRYRKKIKNDRSLILLDVFILKNSFNKGFYSDRYYPGLLDHISLNEREYLYYVPAFYGIKDYGKVFSDLSMTKQNFLIKEDYLKFKDYIFALFYPFRTGKFNFKSGEFMGFDVSSLLKEEISNDRVSNSAIYGLLNYNFSRRLKEKKVKIKTIVNWFENQTIDHGFNSGFRKYYPEVNLVGYLGIPLQDNYLSIYPTEQERICKVIPKDIFIIGKGYIDDVKQFCKNLSVKVAPAFRLSGVWNKRNYYPDKDKYSVLVALPILMDESDEIINIVIETARLIKIENCFFKIKPHPSQNIEVLKNKWAKKLTSEFEFITGDFNSCIENANILISCASSVCLETLAKGIPVVIIASKIELTELVIPQDIEQDIWKLCYTAAEVNNAIMFYQKRSKEILAKYKKLGEEIREKYFEPITESGVKRLLNL